MNKLNIFVTIIICTKVIFLTIALYDQYIKRTQPHNKKLIDKLNFYKERMEFLFIMMMSILLVHLFNPRVDNLHLISNELKFLLFMYGIVLILSAKWELFIEQTWWL